MDMKPHAEEGSSTTRFIPPDVVASILVRLPAKAVARLRCVCKQWHSWTREHSFIDEHRRLGAFTSLAITHCLRRERSVPAALYEVGDELKRSPLLIRLNGDVSVPASFYGYPSNSVNGLVAGLCVSRSMLDPPDSILQPYLINPITRDHLQVLDGRFNRSEIRIELGLGFDASRGVYKLVTFQAASHTHFALSSSCKVLTVGAGGWRDVGWHAPCFVESPPVSPDGDVYWLACAVDRLRVILAFDVEDEKFRFIPVPKTRFGIALKPKMNLLALDGRVCFAESTVCSTPATARVWKLEGEPGHEHWRLEYEIDMSDWMGKTESHATAWIAGIRDTPWVDDIRGGRAILRTSHSICYYDLRTNTLHNLLNYIETLLPPSSLIAESLISPSNLIEG